MKNFLKPHLVNYSMTFSPCHNYIAVSNNFNSINILNLNNEKEQGLVTCSSNSTANVYNIKNCGNYLICTSDCYIIAWNWSDIINQLSSFCSDLNSLWKLTLPLNSEFLGCLQIISMHINETKKIIYVGCSDGYIHLWQICNDGVATYLKFYKACSGSVLSLTSGKGYSLISGYVDGTVRFWDDRQENESLKIEIQHCEEVRRSKLGNCINVIATDPESSDWILCGGQPKLSLWNVRAGRVGVVMEIGDKQIDDSWIPFSAILRDDLIISGGNSSKLYLWDLSGQLNSEISLGASNNVYDLLHRKQTDFNSGDCNDFFLCGWGPGVELYSDIGYRKRIFPL